MIPSHLRKQGGRWTWNEVDSKNWYRSFRTTEEHQGSFVSGRSFLNALKNWRMTPESRGSHYEYELAGLRSVKAVHQRYRIVYQVEHEEVVVLVVAVGLRKEGRSLGYLSSSRTSR